MADHYRQNHLKKSMLVHDLTFYPAKHLHGIPERARESIKDRNKNLSCYKLLLIGETLNLNTKRQYRKTTMPGRETSMPMGLLLGLTLTSVYLFLNLKISSQ